jgi:hypothetical protein
VFESLVLGNFLEGAAGLVLIIVLIRSAIRDSMLVTPHMSASLANLIVAVTASSSVNLLKLTWPRYSYYSSSLKLQIETTPSILVKVVDCCSPS